MTVTTYLGDCLEVLPTLPEGSVDMILTDLPYGMTQNRWDSVIPFGPMWDAFGRVIRDDGIIALNAGNPFSSALLMSRPEWFRHEWIWAKNKGSNFANTVREPMKDHEHVLIFSPARSGWTYNPIRQPREDSGAARVAYPIRAPTRSENYGRFMKDSRRLSVMRCPSTVQHWDVEHGLHPTQKPVSMCEYLIRTYTDEGMTVLDCCMGSGTTGVAAVRAGRSFIGIERDPTYYEAACDRISGAGPRALPGYRSITDYIEEGSRWSSDLTPSPSATVANC